MRPCGIDICGGIGGKMASMLSVGAELGVVGWFCEKALEEQHCFHASTLLLTLMVSTCFADLRCLEQVS